MPADKLYASRAAVDEANAALRLGERCLPPAGALVCLHCRTWLYIEARHRLTASIGVVDGQLVRRGRLIALALVQRGRRVLVPIEDVALVEILRLPADAPPVHAWEPWPHDRALRP